MSDVSTDYLGIYQGIVVDNNDPTKSGRVRAQIPAVLADQASAWCQPIYPTVYTPKSGEVVWVQFISGDLTKPVYFSSDAVTAEKIKAKSIEFQNLSGDAVSSIQVGTVQAVSGRFGDTQNRVKDPMFTKGNNVLTPDPGYNAALPTGVTALKPTWIRPANGQDYVEVINDPDPAVQYGSGLLVTPGENYRCTITGNTAYTASGTSPELYQWPNLNSQGGWTSFSAAGAAGTLQATATAWSSTVTYQVGEYVLYNGLYYRCVTNNLNRPPDVSVQWDSGAQITDGAVWKTWSYATDGNVMRLYANASTESSYNAGDAAYMGQTYIDGLLPDHSYTVSFPNVSLVRQWNGSSYTFPNKNYEVQVIMVMPDGTSRLVAAKTILSNTVNTSEGMLNPNAFTWKQSNITFTVPSEKNTDPAYDTKIYVNFVTYPNSPGWFRLSNTQGPAQGAALGITGANSNIQYLLLDSFSCKDNAPGTYPAELSLGLLLKSKDGTQSKVLTSRVGVGDIVANSNKWVDYTTFSTKSGVLTIPDGNWYYGYPLIRTGATGNRWTLTNWVVNKMNAGSLMVDGTITAAALDTAQFPGSYPRVSVNPVALLASDANGVQVQVPAISFRTSPTALGYLAVDPSSKKLFLVPPSNATSGTYISMDSQTVTVLGSGGSLVLDSGGNINITTANTINIGNAGAINLASTGQIFTSSNADTFIYSNGGSNVNLNAQGSGARVNITSAAATTVTANNINLNASGSVAVSASANLSLTASGNIAVTATQPATSVRIDATRIDLTAYGAGTSAFNLFSNGNLNMTAVGRITLSDSTATSASVLQLKN